MKNWYEILTHVKKWYQIITHVKNWYLLVTYASDKTVKNWNWMHNASGLGGNLSMWGNTHVCCMKFDFVGIFHKVWDIGTKYVAHWYHFPRHFFMCCEELVPILHSMKFAKCEICDSTRLRPKFRPLVPMDTLAWAIKVRYCSTKISR